ncbi:MAG: hypothetical protein PHV20_12320 [Bacteroidales bacterium]|nr:hypothetical protein [Bacteroidales bacterium]
MMKKYSLFILFLLSLAMALTFVSCKTHTLTSKTESDLKLKVDSAGISVNKSVVQTQFDSTSYQRKDSTALHNHSDSSGEREVKETFAPYITPNGEVIPLLNSRTSTEKHRKIEDNTLTTVSQINFWRNRFDSLKIGYDSLSTHLKLLKSQNQKDKTIDKDEPPNYTIWIVVILIALCITFWVYKTA